jgi:Zn-dependent protease
MRHGPAGAVFGVVLMLALFACVVLHELGHSIVAQGFGVGVKEILLLPIGGLARLTSEPRRPAHELLIAVAGPLVNVVIAIALLVLSSAALGSEWLLGGGMLHALAGPPSLLGLLALLILSNVALAVFNMIPALPMDGGRVFRALLSFVLGKPRATEVAATVGQVLAAGLAVFGILGPNLVLALIGGFVFLGAAQERAAARALVALEGLTAADGCNEHAVVLSPADRLGVALAVALRTPQSHFAVVHGDRVVGTLSREDMKQWLPRAGADAYVAALMRRDIAEVPSAMPLSDVRQTLLELAGQPVLVRGADGHHGLIGLEDLHRIAVLAELLRRHGAHPARASSAPSVSTF